MDVKRGLCQDCLDGARSVGNAKPPHTQTPSPRRLALQTLPEYPQKIVKIAASAVETETRLEMLKNAAKKVERITKPEPKPTFSPAAKSAAPKTDTAELKSAALVTTVGVPRDSFLAEHLGLKKTPTPPALGFELDVAAANIFYLNGHEREIIQDLIHDRIPVGMTKASADARLSGLCSKVGIPKTNRFEAYDRRGALGQVWARYEQMRAEERQGRTLPSRANLEHQSTKAEEEELLKIFRSKGSRARDAILGFARKV